jgi:hypothetical protein
MSPQELWFSVAGVFYFFALLPSCMDERTEMSRTSTFTTAVLMAGSAAAYSTLDMLGPAAMMALGAGQWGFLFLRRPVRPFNGIREVHPD